MKFKLLFVAILISASVVGQNVPSYVPTNGLVGWWPFNGNANDLSGNGNNGTVNGATLTTDRFGNSNSAYSFDGVDDYIDMQSLLSSLNNQPAATFSFWANFSQQNGCIIGHWASCSGCTNFNLGVIIERAGSSNVLFSNNSGIGANLTQSITNNTLNHIVFVLDGTQSSPNTRLICYINGQAITLSYGIVNNSIGTATSTFFGRRDMDFGSFGNYFGGTLDDIGIWNRALTPQEITALYSAQNCNGGNTITPDGPTTFCAGNSVKLTSSILGATYQWKRNGVNINGATSRRYTAIQGGSYTCVATCNGTPVTSNTIQLTWLENKPVTLSAAGSTAFCVGDSVTLNVTNPGANYSIQWYRTNISLPSQTGTSLVVTQPGTYKVVTRNNLNGCSRISSSGITTTSNCRMADREVGEGINEDEELSSARVLENENSQGVKIYPNPNQGRFRFEYRGHESGSATLQVINSMGQQLHEQQVEVVDGLLNTDIQLNGQFTSGIYIVRLVLNGGMHDSRMVVE